MTERRRPRLRRRHGAQRHARDRQAARPALALRDDPDRVPLPLQPQRPRRRRHRQGDAGGVPRQAAHASGGTGSGGCTAERAPGCAWRRLGAATGRRRSAASTRSLPATASKKRSRGSRQALSATSSRRRATLFFDLLGPLAAEAGKPALVEMSCFTIASAPGLARIFPEARFVHAVRDGRDSGSSKAAKRQKAHHPTGRHRRDRLVAGAPAARRGGRARAGRPRAASSRSASTSWSGATASGAYGDLLGFLELADEPAMREFFASQMSAEAAHRERWREGLARGRPGGDPQALRGGARRARGPGLPLRRGAAPRLRAHVEPR